MGQLHDLCRNSSCLQYEAIMCRNQYWDHKSYALMLFTWKWILSVAYIQESKKNIFILPRIAKLDIM